MTDHDDWTDDGSPSAERDTALNVTLDTATDTELPHDDDGDDLDAERLPTDVPALASVMRDAKADVDTSKARRGDVNVEVLVCVEGRLRDVAMLPASDSFRWNDEFTLVTHRGSGLYDITVPQDSAWKMFHRGDGDVGVVRRVVSEHGPEPTRCHAANPDSNGRFEMEWTVTTDGAVRNAHVLLDELHSQEMSACLRRAIESWCFPTPTGGPAVVSFPFRFKNENR